MNIKELIPNAQYTDTIICENLFLKRWGSDRLAVVSDADSPKAQSNETYRNRVKLGKARFHWDGGAKVWWIEPENLKRAQEILHDLNNTPLEKFIQKVEELPEMAAEPTKRDELKDKVDGFITDLSDSVNEEAMNEKVRAYLNFNAKFRKYSWHNTLLIWIQNPKATKVATYNQWREEHHRQVRKGSSGKGITLLRPITVGGKEKEPEAPATPGSPTVPAPVPDPAALGDKKTGGFTRYVAFTVFDIADTDPIDERGEIPEEPVWHGSNEPHEMADEIFSCALEVAKKMGIVITQDVSMGGEQGWASGGHVNITSTIDGVNKAATVIHEIAHELLHFRKTSPLYIGDESSMGIAAKEVKELQAESVSYVVIRYYELPAEHQATYVALWKGNKDRVIENLDTIKKAAQFIIDKIDAEQDRRNSAAAVTGAGTEVPVQKPTTERLFECIDGNRFKLTSS